MGKLKHIPPFLGTLDGICIYTRWGNHYVRTRSTLNGKRVKTAPEFKKTMEHASVLSSASKLASIVYSALEVKDFPLYRQLTGRAMKLLKAGMKEEQVLTDLGEFASYTKIRTI